MGEKTYVSKAGKQNYGVSILKTLMCFVVVCCHFLPETISTEYRWIIFLERCAVPVFMFISFFYFGNKIQKKSVDLTYRCNQLYFPLFSWAIVYFLVYSSLFYILHIGNKISIADFLWQCFTGHSASINPAMWFQIVLILYTVIIYGLFNYLDKKFFALLLVVFSVISYYLQYSGILYDILSGLRFELRFPIGRVFEMLPIVALSLLIGPFLNSFKYKHLNIGLGVFLVGIAYCLYLAELKFFGFVGNFGYSGISLAVFSLGIFNIFYSLPEVFLKNKNVIRIITKYTMGIYCIHNLVGRIIVQLLRMVGLSINDFGLCFLIYLLSYFCCLLINAVPNRYIKRLVN